MEYLWKHDLEFPGWEGPTEDTVVVEIPRRVTGHVFRHLAIVRVLRLELAQILHKEQIRIFPFFRQGEAPYLRIDGIGWHRYFQVRRFESGHCISAIMVLSRGILNFVIEL
jgi:hypothetical protein